MFLVKSSISMRCTEQPKGTAHLRELRIPPALMQNNTEMPLFIYGLLRACSMLMGEQCPLWKHPHRWQWEQDRGLRGKCQRWVTCAAPAVPRTNRVTHQSSACSANHTRLRSPEDLQEFPSQLQDSTEWVYFPRKP